MKVAVAGTGYVGLSMAVLLSQHNEVRALDIVPGKVEKINSWRSPIRDREIERFMREAEAGGEGAVPPRHARPGRGLRGGGLRRGGHAHELRPQQELLRHQLR